MYMFSICFCILYKCTHMHTQKHIQVENQCAIIKKGSTNPSLLSKPPYYCSNYTVLLWFMYFGISQLSREPGEPCRDIFRFIPHRYKVMSFTKAHLCIFSWKQHSECIYLMQILQNNSLYTVLKISGTRHNNFFYSSISSHKKNPTHSDIIIPIYSRLLLPTNFLFF